MQQKLCNDSIHIKPKGMPFTISSSRVLTKKLVD